MKRIAFLLILVLLASSIKAQEGARLLTNFKESNEIENQNWAICQDDQSVMMFANRFGITTLDGQGWGYIQIPAIPYALKYNQEEKRVYVGADNNYGYLSRDETGVYRYFSMSGDSSSIGAITRIIFSDSTVYFYGEQSISRHNLASGKLELRLTQKNNEPFTGMFLTPKNTFINIQSKGLYRLESDTLFPIVTGYMTKDDEILFCLPYSNTLSLIGKNNGSLTLFDGIKYYDYPIKDEGYLKQNILSEGLAISDSLYAFSTLEGGALVVEKLTGKLKYTINYINGLPDDEIFALGADNNHGLWLSHQYGLTRADMKLPIDNFSIYPGLKGNLMTSLWYKNELYVATSEGVYYLNEIKNYSEVEILVSKQGMTPPSGRESIKTTPILSQIKETQKTRKGIFSQIFGKKPGPADRTAEKKESKPDQQPLVIAPSIKLPEPMYFKKVTGKLKSINYSYKKVEGLTEKCKQLVPSPNGILASTNKGLFIINNHKANAIVNNGYINSISSGTSDNRYFIATSEGYYYITPGFNNKWSVVYPDRSFNHSIYSIISTGDQYIWAGGDDCVYRMHPENAVADNNTGKFKIKNELPQRYIIELVHDTLFLFTLSQISYFDTNLNRFVDYNRILTGNGVKLRYIFNQPGIPWVRTEDEWINISSAGEINSNDKSLLKIFDNLNSINADKDNIWVINGENMIYRIVRNKIPTAEPDLSLFIRSISDAREQKVKLSDIVFDSDASTIYFDLVAPGYLKKNSTQFQYIVDKEMKEWTKWSPNNSFSLIFKPGKHVLKVRAKDIWGNVSEPKLIGFTIETPFTQTTTFYGIIAVSLFVIIIGIIRFRERQLKKDKRVLEIKVKERTAQIEAQKQEITSSIEYASRIQMAMLPEDYHFRKSFSDYFIIFSPRDIVSGDFYWIGEDENRIFFTVADCTGHGVPGAFMSALGISILDEIITNNPDLKANEVLNMLREKIKTSLHQTGKQGEATDGMDVAFCILHKNKKFLEFAGAYNPMFLFQNGEFTEFRADRMPIGIYYGEKESFTNYEINIRKGDTLYIFSDGFADQFGGDKGTKYMKYNLKKLLIEIHFKPMAEQQVILQTEFEKWKGTVNQIDDVTILGVRI